jgi:hypothetical protein
MTSLPQEAVEALAGFNYAKHVHAHDYPEDWENETPGHRRLWLNGAREQLEAAAPFIAAQERERLRRELLSDAAVKAVVEFLDAWRYCPVSSASSPSRRPCLEESAKQLLAALPLAPEPVEEPTHVCQACGRGVGAILCSGCQKAVPAEEAGVDAGIGAVEPQSPGRASVDSSLTAEKGPRCGGKPDKPHTVRIAHDPVVCPGCADCKAGEVRRPYRAGLRDRIVVGLANALLRLASKQYRDLLGATISKGFAGALRDAGYPLAVPFTEPLDDPASDRSPDAH